jgi:translation initiation factor IF-2
MKVSELAKELKTSSDEVLKRLRSLKLKAKDSKQELNSVVLSVLRSDLKRNPFPVISEKVQEKKISEKVDSKATEKVTATKKKIVKKKIVKRIVKKKAVKKEESVSPEIVSEIPKKKVAPAPFVTLKPLVKKRKRRPGAIEGVSFEQRSDERTSDQITEQVSPSSVEKVSTQVVEPPLKELEIKVPITVKDFAVKIQQKPSIVLMKLMQMGIMANINLNLDEDIVRKLAAEFGFKLLEVKTQEQQVIDFHKEEEEDSNLLKPRAPVVTFMGHVDHGKTSLLDKIRKSKLADSEHGGITQHIGAYSVPVRKGKITFLDTPGHEAFTAMRARGAHITDLVVVVIAADEGIMPQTEEAIDHAQAAEVPIVIALNKIDSRNADIDRVKKQLQDRGLTPEDWGGKTITVGVSAMTGEGIDQLLEMILLESELLELQANPDKNASGIVVEAHLSRGKGAVADLIVQSGTLKEGDHLVVGPYYGRVKAMLDDHEKNLQLAGPATPVEVLGLPGVPEAGEIFYVVDDEKQAKEIATRRQEILKKEKLGSQQKLTLEDLQSQILEGKIKELNVIIKADVQGSLEALKDSLAKIPSQEVKLRFIHTGVGDVNLSDVLLAVASKAVIICFHTGIEVKARAELDKFPVDVRKYRIIYDAVNDIRNALEGMLAPKIKKKFLGRVEIREVFKLSRSGIVAGCFVQKGKVHRKAHMDIVRNGEVAYSGKISSLKRFKDDVKDVSEGMECGITIEGYDKIQAGDIIEAYDLEEIARKL